MDPERSNDITKFDQENDQAIQIDLIDPESRDDIAAYYQFEIDQNFSEVNPKTTFEKMVAYRQGQIRDGQLQVATIKENDQIIATTVIVLKSGTMGPKFRDDEAWATGTVVHPKKRNAGIGNRLAMEQERIAEKAGKKSILTLISNDNNPSMRLRMNIGYRLEGIDKRENETNYVYRKNISSDINEDTDWPTEVQAENISIIDGDHIDSDADTILIDPDNVSLVQEALHKNYEGVFLLRPKDFDSKNVLDRNAIVFVKKSAMPAGIAPVVE